MGVLLSDWPSDHCIVTRNVSSRAAIATSPWSDKVHCPGVTSRSDFTELRRFLNCTIDNSVDYISRKQTVFVKIAIGLLLCVSNSDLIHSIYIV